MAKTVLAQDPRPISAVDFFIEDGAPYRGGTAGVTKIEAYDEHGPGDFMPWVAVYSGDEIIARIPAHHVSVHYERESKSDG